jgi:hypothetical protein
MSIGEGRNRVLQRAPPYKPFASKDGKLRVVPKTPLNRKQRRAAARLAGRKKAKGQT